MTIAPDDIAALKARLDALRPLAAGSLAVLDRWMDVELTYTSNAIEGSTLSRSETAIVIEKGLTIGGKPLRDHLEAIDHMDALAFMRALASSGELIREADIRELHRLVLQRSNPDEAGRYSPFARAIAGSPVRFPLPFELPGLMADFATWLQQAPAEPATAFEAHYRLVTIHPFSDGNGRTARLIMNLILIRAGYPPVVIGPTERARYLEALEQRQLGTASDAWDALMRERLADSLIDYLERVGEGDLPRP